MLSEELKGSPLLLDVSAEGYSGDEEVATQVCSYTALKLLLICCQATSHLNPMYHVTLLPITRQVPDSLSAVQGGYLLCFPSFLRSFTMHLPNCQKKKKVLSGRTQVCWSW